MNRSSFCTECGAIVPAAALYCSGCGLPAPRTCPECGRPCGAQARFCGSCGAAMPMPAEAATSLLQLSERKLVTVMFVDMIGSLAAIRDADPEEAHDLLSRVLSAMTGAVHSCGGTVVRTLGDGLMVLFGAPAAREDHAVAACHAALRIVEAVRQIPSTLPSLNVRIGLHSGLVVVGQAANDLGTDYDATGVAVHIASRLQNAASPGSTVMSEATRKLVGRDMLTRSLGPVVVKGLDAPIEVFELCGISQQAQPAVTAAEDVFVGRASELADLAGALRSALLGKGHLVAVVGEAGIGKTRFIDRFLEMQAGSVAGFRASLERYAGAVPFHSIRNLLSSMLGIAVLPAGERHAALQQRLRQLELAIEDIETPLADLLETQPAPASWLSLDPQTRRHMTVSAVSALLLRESERNPFILVIEDIQRADSATLDMIGALADAILHHRILFLVSFRPDFANPWGGKEAYRQLRLERLTAAETDGLVDHLVARDATRDLRRLLASWSQGNPLFLHEVVHTMVDHGILGGDAGSRVLLGEPDRTTPPDSVTAMIAERVDRLPAALKGTLLAASILGEQFALDMLAEITGENARDLTTRVAALEAQEFVRQTAHFPRAVFRFRHALFQEVCYASLLKKRRRELHAVALAAIGRSEATDSSSRTEQLAYHAFRGGLWEQAVEHCRAAGRRALYLSANREAVRHLENATTALARADPQGYRLAEAIDLQLELRAAHVPLLHLDRVGRLLAESRDCALRLGDRHRLAQITGFLAGHAYLTQEPQRCQELCLAALQLAKRAGDPALQVAPNIYLGQAFHALGRFRKSVAALKRNFAILSRLDPQANLGLPSLPTIMTARWIALSLAELGRFDEAETYLRHGSETGQMLRPFDVVYSKSALGFVLLVRGDFVPAREETAAALVIADQRDLPFMVPVVASQLGLLLAFLGEHEESLQLVRRAVRSAEDIGIAAGRTRWYARLSECCLLAGDVAEARRYAQISLDMAERSDEQGYWCYALRLRGRITLAQPGDVDAARTDITVAGLRARQLGMAPLSAKCALDLAQLERRAGRPDRASHHLAQAIGGFRQLGMQAWIARAMAEMDTPFSLAQ